MILPSFQMPECVTVKNLDNFYGEFICRPLERGYGTTLGNTLRRVLLSSLEGYAITSVRVPGVKHEFDAIEGAMEDMVSIILNLKQVRLRRLTDDNNDSKIVISVKNQQALKAGDITKFTPAFEVLNPEKVICHLDRSARFELEITIDKGRGYVSADEHKPNEQIVGLIPIDAIFTPIKHVEYHVKDFRVGQKTDYEQLTINIKTDGSIRPETALENAAQLLINHFTLFSQKIELVKVQESQIGNEADVDYLRIKKLIDTPLSDLGLSVRSFNCLKAAGLHKLGDILILEVPEMMKFRNFGRKSLEELEEIVKEHKLSFGMDLSQYRS